MAEADPLRKYVEAGIAFTQLTKTKAEAIVRELVKAGDVQREQAQDRVEELLDRSRKSTESMGDMIRKELAQQLSSMGFATKADVEALEARLEARIAAATGSPASPTPSAEKTPPPATRKAAPRNAAPGAAKGAAPSGDATKTRVGTAKKATPPPGTAARTAAAKAGRRRPAPGADADQV